MKKRFEKSEPKAEEKKESKMTSANRAKVEKKEALGKKVIVKKKK